LCSRKKSESDRFLDSFRLYLIGALCDARCANKQRVEVSTYLKKFEQCMREDA